MATEFNFIPFDSWHLTDTAQTGGGVPNPIPLGTTRWDRQTNGVMKKYIWGQVALSLINSVLAANEVVNLSACSATAFTFTNDVSTSLAGGSRPVGAARANAAIPTSTSTKTYYGWLQIGGPATIKTNGDNDGVVGDAFIPATGTDGAANVAAIAATSTDGTIGMEFAIALASEAASACSVLLRCPDFAGM